MHKHKVLTQFVSFTVPKITPQVKNLTVCDHASAFARKLEEEFADRGVTGVMVELSRTTGMVHISMTLHRYAVGDGEYGFFTERGLDMHFDNFYNRFPFDK